jgi:hypothetical protein
MIVLLLRTLVVFMLGSALISMAGCGDGGETNSPSTALTSSTVNSNSAINPASNHTHTAVIPFSDLGGGKTVSYRTSVTSGHSHVIALSSGQLSDLYKGYRVLAISSVSSPATDSHTHLFDIQGGQLVYESICYNCHSNDKRGISQMNSSQPPLQSQKNALKSPSSQPISTGVTVIPDPNYGTTAQTLTISTTMLTAATVGTPYSQNLTATGGTSPYFWLITGLPGGLSSSGSVISGTPTTSGSFTITVKVTDSVSTATTPQNYTLVVNAAPLVQPALNTLTPNCATACHGLPPTSIVALSGAVAIGMPHTTNSKCGTCHVIGGWVSGTTTFDMSGVTTHQNGTINFLAGLPTASCSACHTLPPTSGHPSVATKSYVANCGICHLVGAGNPITMGISTHQNGVVNFNP